MAEPHKNETLTTKLIEWIDPALDGILSRPEMYGTPGEQQMQFLLLLEFRDKVLRPDAEPSHRIVDKYVDLIAQDAGFKKCVALGSAGKYLPQKRVTGLLRKLRKEIINAPENTEKY